MNLTLYKILAIGSGGFIGAVSRYLLSTFVQNQVKPEQFPIGIFVVNIIGCLLIGFLAGLFELKEWMNVELRLFVFVGLLGGFTTFSTFANDTFLLGKEGEMLAALLNAGGQVIVGLLFVWLGYLLIRYFV
ncbi:MAG: fluoride efflux transporter CrcB [Balneolaceae bacterium]|nr:fluoride efflux transporter CrcB [Balneolaceae bacterium]